MPDDDNNPYGRPDGHRYDAPESDDDRELQGLGLPDPRDRGRWCCWC